MPGYNYCCWNKAVTIEWIRLTILLSLKFGQTHLKTPTIPRLLTVVRQAVLGSLRVICDSKRYHNKCGKEVLVFKCVCPGTPIHRQCLCLHKHFKRSLQSRDDKVAIYLAWLLIAQLPLWSFLLKPLKFLGETVEPKKSLIWYGKEAYIIKNVCLDFVIFEPQL